MITTPTKVGPVAMTTDHWEQMTCPSSMTVILRCQEDVVVYPTFRRDHTHRHKYRIISADSQSAPWST